MMNHCGSIMAHGRELRIYRRPLILGRFRRTERIDWREVVTALEAAFTGFAAIARS
jgi:hypothetical protein